MADGVVFDASALLAWLHREPGREVIRDALRQPAAMSVLNLAEVLTKLTDMGANPRTALGDMERDGLVGADGLIRVEPVLTEDAIEAARLRPTTRSLGLSLGDRVCLATAARLGMAALTADRRWTEIAHPAISVRLIR